MTDPSGCVQHHRSPPFRVTRRVTRDAHALAGTPETPYRCGAQPDDYDVAEVPVPGPTPLDVHTWADYEAVVAAAGQPLGGGVMVAPVSAGARRRGLRD